MPPKVSAVIITYNQGKFLEDAIRSVMMQEASFAFDLVIGDDCSTDETEEICRRWQAKFPSRIRVLRTSENSGGALNILNALAACEGKYTAFLEGDDFWIDTKKLQVQFDFMEANPQIVICGHSTIRLNHEEGLCIFPEPSYPSRVFSLHNIFVEGAYLHSNSFFFKKGTFHPTPDWFFQSVCGDISMLTIATTKGHGYVLEAPLGVHRASRSGTWFNRSPEEKLRVYVGHLILMKKEFPEDSDVPRQIVRFQTKLMLNVFRNRGFRAAFLELGGILSEENRSRLPLASKLVVVVSTLCARAGQFFSMSPGKVWKGTLEEVVSGLKPPFRLQSFRDPRGLS